MTFALGRLLRDPKGSHFVACSHELRATYALRLDPFPAYRGQAGAESALNVFAGIGVFCLSRSGF
jgi:hypothetical protein